MLAETEIVQADLIGQFHPFEELLQAMTRAHLRTGNRIAVDIAERVDAELHPASLRLPWVPAGSPLCLFAAGEKNDMSDCRRQVVR
jgi:hypothetical protein